MKHLFKKYYLLLINFQVIYVGLSNVPAPPSHWLEKLRYHEVTFEYNILPSGGPSQLDHLDRGSLKPKELIENHELYLLNDGTVIEYIFREFDSEAMPYYRNIKTIYRDSEKYMLFDENDQLLSSHNIKDINPSYIPEYKTTLVKDGFTLTADALQNFSDDGYTVTEIYDQFYSIQKDNNLLTLNSESNKYIHKFLSNQR